MGSDPQSMLQWDYMNCKCYASKRLPELVKIKEEYEKLEKTVRAFLNNRKTLVEFIKEATTWTLIKDGYKKPDST